MAADRITKQVIKYINDMHKKAKQMKFVKDLKKEVNINANGSSRYKIKEGYVCGKGYDSSMKDFEWVIYIKHRSKLEYLHPLNFLKKLENSKSPFDIPANSGLIIQIG